MLEFKKANTLYFYKGKEKGCNQFPFVIVKS